MDLHRYTLNIKLPECNVCLTAYTLELTLSLVQKYVVGMKHAHNYKIRMLCTKKEKYILRKNKAPTSKWCTEKVLQDKRIRVNKIR